MYEIEKNVPYSSGPKSTKYPFRQMEIGDSFLVPSESEEKHVVRSAAYQFAKIHSVNLRTKTVDGGVRVWRVE